MLRLRIAKIATVSSIALLPAALAAQSTTISTDVTGTQSTSTEGDITITEDGSVTVTSGSAVVVDSSNDVTNGGTITAGEDDGATGIEVQPGFSADVTNTGTISVLEDFTGEDDDNNNIADGAIADATDRFGIRVLPGGTFTGNIRNEGEIEVDGLNSAGIAIDSELVGDLIHSGEVRVVGDNSVGVRTADVTGDVELRGSILVVGQASSAYISGGDIDGSLLLQNTIAQAASFTADDGSTLSLSRDALRAGEAAVSVQGNVTGGIIVDIPPVDNDANNDDEDGDGIPDADEGTGVINSVGVGPALEIGGANAITIGATGSGFGVQIDGTVSGNGSGRGIDAIGFQVGGTGNGVTIDGGISVAGRVQAITTDSQATALLIETDATVERLHVTDGGVVTATISSPGDGTTYAVRDLSGTLTEITNSGFITATGTFEDTVVAIDLSANTSGVTINQVSPAEETETEEAAITTGISGDILLGSGDDQINASDGQINSDSFLGDGADTVALSGDALYTGDIDFGNGDATLTFADTSRMSGELVFNNQNATVTLNDEAQFRGEVSGGDNLTVDVQGGSFGANDTDTLSFDTLNVGADGTVVVFVDANENESSLIDVTNANFADGAAIGAVVDTLEFTDAEFLVLTADNLTGTPIYAEEDSDLPFLYVGEITTDNAAGEVRLGLRRKTSGEVGFDPELNNAFEAVLAAAVGDNAIEASLLQADDQATLQAQVSGLLPEYTGGNFDLATSNSRLAAARLWDHDTWYDISNSNAWLNLYGLRGDRDLDVTGDYSLDSFGITGGYEWQIHPDIGRIGLSLNAAWGSNENDDIVANSDLTQYEIGLHWRSKIDNLIVYGRGTFGFLSFDSERTFTGEVNGSEFSRLATGSFDGFLYSGLVGASYQAEISPKFSITPRATLEYFRLDEDGYTETGGGDGVNLTLADRNSESMMVDTVLEMSYRIGDVRPDTIPLSISLEGGRRSHLQGDLGVTQANFDGGNTFTLPTTELEDAWLGKLTVSGGGYDYKWKLQGGAEKGSERSLYTVSAILEVAF